jgi:hypothetical protein
VLVTLYQVPQVRSEENVVTTAEGGAVGFRAVLAVLRICRRHHVPLLVEAVQHVLPAVYVVPLTLVPRVHSVGGNPPSIFQFDERHARAHEVALFVERLRRRIIQVKVVASHPEVRAHLMSNQRTHLHQLRQTRNLARPVDAEALSRAIRDHRRQSTRVQIPYFHGFDMSIVSTELIPVQAIIHLRESMPEVAAYNPGGCEVEVVPTSKGWAVVGIIVHGMLWLARGEGVTLRVDRVQHCCPHV